jgi:hypothetical protein
MDKDQVLNELLLRAAFEVMGLKMQPPHDLLRAVVLSPWYLSTVWDDEQHEIAAALQDLAGDHGDDDEVFA